MARQKPCLGNNGPCPTRALTRDNTGRCDTCRTARDKARGSREARGYDHAHRELRKQYEPIVKAGNATCAHCHQPIAPDADWDLGHDTNRRHHGPEHAACNRATQAKRKTAGQGGG
jgi:hypothetical protein